MHTHEGKYTIGRSFVMFAAVECDLSGESPRDDDIWEGNDFVKIRNLPP